MYLYILHLKCNLHVSPEVSFLLGTLGEILWAPPHGPSLPFATCGLPPSLWNAFSSSWDWIQTWLPLLTASKYDWKLERSTMLKVMSPKHLWSKRFKTATICSCCMINMLQLQVITSRCILAKTALSIHDYPRSPPCHLGVLLSQFSNPGFGRHFFVLSHFCFSLPTERKPPSPSTFGALPIRWHPIPKISQASSSSTLRRKPCQEWEHSNLWWGGSNLFSMIQLYASRYVWCFLCIIYITLLTVPSNDVPVTLWSGCSRWSDCQWPDFHVPRNRSLTTMASFQFTAQMSD